MIHVCIDNAAYVTKFVQPDPYAVPETARVAGRASGTVVVTVELDEKGDVVSTSISHSDSPFLNAAVIEAARKSTYAPATHGCDPIASEYRYTAEFATATGGSSAYAGKGTRSYSGSNSSSTTAANCTPGSAFLKSAPTLSLPNVPLTQAGAATIQVAVDRDGKVAGAIPGSSDVPKPYADAALAMVKAATFSPRFTADCKPAPDTVDVSVGFHP